MTSKGTRGRLGATDSGPRLGGFPLGSAQSRAAARAILNARVEREAEEDWDKEPDLTGLAESLEAVRQRRDRGETFTPNRSPIYIPPGKENTTRGRIAVRITEAHARTTRFEAEMNADKTRQGLGG